MEEGAKKHHCRRVVLRLGKDIKMKSATTKVVAIICILSLAIISCWFLLKNRNGFVPVVICMLGLALIDGWLMAKELVGCILWITFLVTMIAISCWFLIADRTNCVPVIICILGLAVVGGGFVVEDKLQYLLVLTCILSTAIIGCGSFMDKLTPADIPKPALDYLGKEPNAVGIHSLYTARQIKNDVIVKHQNVQSDLLHLAEKDKFDYLNAFEMIDASIKEGENFQDMVVGSEKQPFSLLGLLAGATGGGFIGYRIKRKEDKNPDEVKALIADARDIGWDECEARVTNDELHPKTTSHVKS